MWGCQETRAATCSRTCHVTALLETDDIRHQRMMYCALHWSFLLFYAVHRNTSTKLWLCTCMSLVICSRLLDAVLKECILDPFNTIDNNIVDILFGSKNTFLKWRTIYMQLLHSNSSEWLLKWNDLNKINLILLAFAFMRHLCCAFSKRGKNWDKMDINQEF